MNDTVPAQPRPVAPPDGYQERLWPSPAVWLVVVGLGAGSGLVTLPFSTVGAILTSLLAVLLLVGLMLAGTPRVEVRDGILVAGRARVPLTALGAVEVLDSDAIRAARGPDLDARAYLCMRGWLGRGVRVELADPADPTPYWLISSRAPDALAAALSGGRQGGTAGARDITP